MVYSELYDMFLSCFRVYISIFHVTMLTILFITFSQNSGSNNGPGNATPSAQVNGGVIGINNASGSYSVTNKTGSPQLPAATPHGRDGSNARHSKLKSIGGGS